MLLSNYALRQPNWGSNWGSSLRLTLVKKCQRSNVDLTLNLLVCDHRSANLSEDAIDYIKAEGIELVAAGPRNPKGNGTDEGAFSQMKRALGTIHIDMSSPKALAKSVLESLTAGVGPH